MFSSLLHLPILKLRRLSSRAPTDAVALAKKHDVSSRRVWHACAFDGLCADVLELLLTSADLQAPSQERLQAPPQERLRHRSEERLRHRSGSVTGAVAGSVTGAVAGSVAGAVAGSVAGAVAGC